MTEGQGQSEGSPRPDKSPSNIGSSHSPTTTNTISSEASIKTGQLFGPFYDPLQWIAYKYTESTAPSPIELHPLDKSYLELFRSVEIARNSSEQNFEIVLKNGQFYFRALCELEASSSRKLFAWFSDELSSKLPTPLSSTLNGGKRYLCGLCNQLFINPNPVVVHILFSCPKRHEILPANVKLPPHPHSTISPQPATPALPVNGPKKRGFDIASLVEKDDLPTVEKRRKTGPQDSCPKSLHNGSHSTHSLTQMQNASVYSDSKSAFRTPLTPPIKNQHSSQMSGPLPSALISSLTSPLSVLPNNTTNMPPGYFPSAFKKVDKHSSPSSFMSASAQFDFASLYGGPRGMVPGASPGPMFAGSSPMSHPMLSPPTGPTGIPTSHASQIPPPNANSLANHGSNKPSIIPTSLLPFLPPSLAALSFPQTNWCAKCNATFRMTSDLVYHMRSHHKMAGPADPVKKKREEKLRCNICGETFRERHHLTRHMTSHN